MNQGSEGRVVAETRGPLLLIAIDRPAKLNAFTPEMFHQLSAAYGRLEDDPVLRCGVLHAAGTSFTAGLDLTRFAESMRQGETVLGEDEIDPFGQRQPARTKPMVVAACSTRSH